ncbi:sensor histidine kinase, partial [Streptomyces niveus]
MTTAGAAGRPMSVEERWEQFHRRGPYALLALSTVISALGVNAFGMTRAEQYAAGALVVAAVALQLCWGRIVRGRPLRGREPSTAGLVFYALRTVIAFVLTWLNPLFS